MNQMQVSYPAPEARFPNRLFVYGTLKGGFGLNPILGDERKFIGHGRLIGYWMFHLGRYPSIVKANDDMWAIHGEVYDITDENLKRVDQAEGHPSFYQRTKVEVPHFGECQTYVQSPEVLFEGKAFIPSGRWTHPEQASFRWHKDVKAGETFIQHSTSVFNPAIPIVDWRANRRPTLLPPPKEPVIQKKVELIVGPGSEEVG